MSAVYLALGVLVFGFTAILVYSNFYRMEIQTAVIAAPVETVTAQADGRIEWTNLQPGDPVKAGEVIVNVVDNQVERELELADIAVREQKAKLTYLKRRQVDELERVQSFATVEMKNVQQTKVDVESLQAQLYAAEQQAKRLTILHSKGFTTDVRLEEAEKQVATLKKSIERNKIELSSRVDLAEQNLGKRLYTGENIVGTLGDIEAQVRLAELEIGIAEDKKKAVLNHKQRLAVTAPFDGTILELPRVNNGHIRRGDVIALVEQRRRRHILAFLTRGDFRHTKAAATGTCRRRCGHGHNGTRTGHPSVASGQRRATQHLFQSRRDRLAGLCA